MASMIPIYGPQMRQLTPENVRGFNHSQKTILSTTNDKIAYKQFGNAVNVKMIERCASFLINNEPLFV